MMDLIIRGGTVVDGTGTAGRRADVGIRDGRVAAVGAVTEDAARVIDAEGCVVAPGFVDIHTHYDAQLFWDPTASPSPLHGVTTIFGGNCGFSLAPAGPDHAAYLSRMLARVEGMPLAALEAGLDWRWGSFGEWLARLDGKRRGQRRLPGRALRRSAVGDGRGCRGPRGQPRTSWPAWRRRCTGPWPRGPWASPPRRAPTHNDGDGQPVPSRSAAIG